MKSPKNTVTLEDLLRVKRAERPPTEFWNEFERELRAKQLAAIVEPRPWWAPLIRVGARFSHLQLPVGAAAVLAVTLMSVRQYETVTSQGVATSSVAMQQSTDDLGRHYASNPVDAYASELTVQQAEPTRSIDYSDYSESLTSETGEIAIASAEELASEPAQMSPARVLELEPSPSARYIAANLAAAQEADPRLMDEVFGHSLRHAQSRQPIRDPLARVSSPGESRRARLLATALPVSAGSTEVENSPNDRIARRLTEDRLYDTISRVGLKGDRVAIKF